MAKEKSEPYTLRSLREQVDNKELCLFCNANVQTGDGTPLAVCEKARDRGIAPFCAVLGGVRPCTKEDWAKCPLNEDSK